jgi:hypothetical protein
MLLRKRAGAGRFDYQLVRLTDELVAELACVKDSTPEEVQIALLLGETIWVDAETRYEPVRTRKLEEELCWS